MLLGMIKVVRKVSLSLPEELFKELDGLAKEAGMTRSSIVTEVLNAYFGKSDGYRGPEAYPTALRKLREQGVIRLRSPKLAYARVRSDWIVEPEV